MPRSHAKIVSRWGPASHQGAILLRIVEETPEVTRESSSQTMHSTTPVGKAKSFPANDATAVLSAKAPIPAAAPASFRQLSLIVDSAGG